MTGPFVARITDGIHDRLVEVELPEGSTVVRSMFKGRDGKPRAYARVPEQAVPLDYHGLLDYYRSRNEKGTVPHGR